MNETTTGASNSQDRGDFASGALFLTMVGLGWVMVGLFSLGAVPLAVLGWPLAVVALLLAGVFALRRAGRHLPPQLSLPETDRAIGRATVWEAIAIVVVAAWANALHRPMWIMPLIAVVVGLHFFPLARALNRPLYQVTGAALCAVGVGVPLLVPAVLGLRHTSGWLLGIGLGGGVVIWLTALALLSYGYTRLHSNPHTL